MPEKMESEEKYGAFDNFDKKVEYLRDKGFEVKDGVIEMDCIDVYHIMMKHRRDVLESVPGYEAWEELRTGLVWDSDSEVNEDG